MNELQLKLARRRALNGEATAVGSLSKSTSIENTQIEYQSLVHDNNLSEPLELSGSSKIEIASVQCIDGTVAKKDTSVEVPVCRLFSSQGFNDDDLLTIFKCDKNNNSLGQRNAESTTARTNILDFSHDESCSNENHITNVKLVSGSESQHLITLDQPSSLNFESLSLSSNHGQEFTVLGSVAEQNQPDADKQGGDFRVQESKMDVEAVSVLHVALVETERNEVEGSDLDIKEAPADTHSLQDMADVYPAATSFHSQALDCPTPSPPPQSAESAGPIGRDSTVERDLTQEQLLQVVLCVPHVTRDVSTSYNSTPQGQRDVTNTVDENPVIENELPCLGTEFENVKLRQEIAALKEQVLEKDALIQSLQLQLSVALSDQGGRRTFNPFDSSNLPDQSDDEINATLSLSQRKDYYLNHYGRKTIPTAELGRFNALDESLFETDEINDFDSVVVPSLVDNNIDSLFDTLVQESGKEFSTPSRKAQTLQLPQTNAIVRAFANTVSDSSYHNRNSNALSPAATSTAAYLTYEEFTFRFHRCEDLLSITRNFVLSIMGPHSDYCTPPNKKMKARYTFHGLQRVEERCRDFFDSMQRTLKQHKEWSGLDLDGEHLLVLRDRLEQYVMTQIGEGAFRSTQSKEEDQQLLRQMKLLSFLTPEAFDIRSDVLDFSLVSSAVDEFRKIEMFRSPTEKILCVEKCISVLYEILTSAQHAKKPQKTAEQRSKDQLGQVALLGDQPPPLHADHAVVSVDSSLGTSSAPPLSAPVALGADDLLPLFIWVVLRSQCPCLYSNCAYIQSFLSPVRLIGQAGYSLVNLESAIAFLTDIGPESLNIDPQEFKRKMEAAEVQMLLEQQQQQQG